MCIIEWGYYLFMEWTCIIIGLNKRVWQRTWIDQNKPTQSIAIDTELYQNQEYEVQIVRTVYVLMVDDLSVVIRPRVEKGDTP